MTEFPSDEPAVHPTGFPVESEPDARPDPETEPGGGEPDFDSEPDRTATPDSTHRNPNNSTPADDPPPSDPTPSTTQRDASDEASEEAADDGQAEADADETSADVASADGVHGEVARADEDLVVEDDRAEGLRDGVAGLADEADEVGGARVAVVGGANETGVTDEAVTGGAFERDGVVGAPAEVGGRVSGGEEGERGHPLVEETMERLEDLRGRPVSEHAEVYADLHERLQSALAEAERPDTHERV